ncbi:glycosyltransferase [Demequina muriae]|uniref:Glycosyltransferase n=1 Tax=Demequina muriae TaxID=3051664 RepID=A0ABT8GIB5_9MICO|nr:glycosyltransferase [Demequina sp. EGI L300058]MDN4481009.1 glycosyltransferase [Demequina sp. EGI L300058]
MSPARLTVRAVVVSDARAPQLFAALDAILAQDPAPDAIHLLLTADVEAPDRGWDPRIDVRRVDADTWGEAVAGLVADVPAAPHELLWLLHDDMAPLPGALAALTATARKRLRAGVIGAAQVRWDDASRLVNLGTTTSRIGARRLALVEEEDVNQGQYDDRDDVLAVSLGGALVRRDVWERLGGIDPGCDGWSESLDFCRRAWRSGHDVVAVPAAKVRHSQERLYGRRGGSGGGRRSTYALRRASEWYHALSYAPLWAVPLLLVWTMLSAVARAVLRIAQNEPRLLVADLVVPWRVLSLVPQLPGSRRRVRHAGREGRAAEKRLLAGTRQIAHHVRALEFGVRDRRKAAAAPTDVVKAELLAARRRRRIVLAAVAVLLAGLSVALRPQWLAEIVSGEMLSGTVLGVTDPGIGALWDRALTGWSAQSLGGPAIDAGLSALLVPLAAVPGGLAVGLGLLLVFTPLAAGLAMWAASGAFTRSLATRGLVAVVYALWPAALVAVEQGRVGAVIVHIVLPWVVLGLARAGGWQRGERIGDGDEHPARPPSSSAAMGAAAMLGVVVIAAPVLLAPALAVVAALGVFAGRLRWRLWGVAIPALVLSAPGLIAAWNAGPFSRDALAILVREPGPSGTAAVQSSLDLLTGLDLDIVGVPQIVTLAARGLAGLVVVAAVVAALIGRRRALSALAALTATLGLMVANLVQGVTLSPDAGAGGAAPAGFYGPGMSVVAVAFLILVTAATADVWFAGAGAARAWRRVGAIAVGAVLVVATAGAATAQAWPARESHGDVDPVPRDVLPLVAAIEQGTGERQRVLTLAEADGAVEYALLFTDGHEVLSSAATLTSTGAPAARRDAAPVAGAADLGAAVAGLVTSSDDAASALAQWGVGVVVAAPGSEGIADALAQTPGLALMGASDRGTSWRIGTPEGEGRVALGWMETSDGVAVARMGYASGTVDAEGPGTLVVGAAADSAWRATLDGAPVVAIDDPLGRQAFAVSGPGEVVFSYDDRGYRAWFWAAAATLGWAVIGSIPARSRRATEEDER